MSYYEINRENLKIYRPLLYQGLFEKEMKDTNDNMEKIVTTLAKDGNSVLNVILEGKEYRLNSLYRPKAEAKRWVEQYTFYNHQTTFIMFGMGNGIFSDTILTELNKDDMLFMYEPSVSIFQHVLHHYDLTSIFQNSNIRIYVEEVNDERFAIDLKNRLNIANYKNLIHCYHPQYNVMYQKSYEKYLKVIVESQRYRVTNINTAIYFNQKFIENNLKNLKYLKDSISLCDLKEMIPNYVPAIVVAAGPSVEANIEHLKRMKGRVVIFAVDRILEYLLDCGIEPDFVVSIDPKKNKEHFSIRKDVKVPLICYGESNYDVLESHCGKKIMGVTKAYTAEFYRRAKKPVPNLNGAGSVAIVTFNACVGLGFKKIILIGQDLAYVGEKSHAGNLVENNELQRDTLVQGINGKMIKSRTDWKAFIETYKDLIHLLSDVEVIDIKLEGAKIPGTINMGIEEVVDKYCTDEIILSREEIEKKVGFTESEWKLVYDYIVESPKGLVEMKKIADKGKAICTDIISLYKKRNIDVYRIDKGMKKLKNINEGLGENPLYPLLDMYVSAVVAEELSAIYKFTGDEKDNQINVIKKSEVVYEAVIKAVDFVNPLLKEAIKNITL